MTGILARLGAVVEIDVGVLARGMLRAGELGSAGLPAAVGASRHGAAGAQFTVIGNGGSIVLGKGDA